MNDCLDAVPVTEGEETNSRTFQTPKLPNGNHQCEETCISKSKLDAEKYFIKSGIAVVINNIEFSAHLELPDRRGSDVDASSLYQRFQELGFESDLLNDASLNEMEEHFTEIKNNKDELEKADCLIIALLTHGKEDGSIYATDGHKKIKSLMEQFNAENCKELINKPKIFLIQACRGPSVGSGVDLRVIRDQDPNQSDAAADPSQYDENFGEIVRIPNEADFLAVYASSEGYGAFRNTEKGSPFVRNLSEELLKMRTGEDFYKVLTRVNRKVGMGYKPNNNQFPKASQMPCFVSHLTKDLVLKQ